MKYTIPAVFFLLVSFMACCFSHEIRKHPKKNMEWPAQEWKRETEDSEPPEWIDARSSEIKIKIAQESK